MFNRLVIAVALAILYWGAGCDSIHGVTRTIPLASVTSPDVVEQANRAFGRAEAASPGHVVSRDALLDALPGGSDDPHRVEVAVARLRESLRASGVDAGLVRTVVKRGYLLAGRT